MTIKQFLNRPLGNVYWPVGQGWRRMFVLLAYLGHAALVVLWTLLPSRGQLDNPTLGFADWATVFGSILVGASYFLMTITTNRIASKSDSLLDERQKELRDNAHRHAYYIFGSTIFLLCILITGDNRWGAVEIPGAFFFAIIAYLTLPTALVAWLEPNPPKEEA